MPQRRSRSWRENTDCTQNTIRGYWNKYAGSETSDRVRLKRLEVDMLT